MIYNVLKIISHTLKKISKLTFFFTKKQYSFFQLTKVNLLKKIVKYIENNKI